MELSQVSEFLIFGCLRIYISQGSESCSFRVLKIQTFEDSDVWRLTELRLQISECADFWMSRNLKSNTYPRASLSIVSFLKCWNFSLYMPIIWVGGYGRKIFLNIWADLYVACDLQPFGFVASVRNIRSLALGPRYHISMVAERRS